MIHADALHSALLTPRALQALHESRARWAREPWLAPSLAAAARHRLHTQLRLPYELQVSVFPSAQLARSTILTQEIKKIYQQQGEPIALHLAEGCSPEWSAALRAWLDFGIVELSSRSLPHGLLLSTAVHHDTGVVQVETTPSSAHILDLTLAALHAPQEWESIQASGVLIALDPLLGLGAPALWITKAEEEPLHFCVTSAVAAGLALEEWEGIREGEGFATARARARVEEVLRETCGALLVGEESERIPGASCIILPGRSAEWLVTFMQNKGIWARRHTPSLLPEQTGLYNQALLLQGPSSTWTALAEQLPKWADPLKRSFRLSEGLTAWPLQATPPDPYRSIASVQGRATRPLYAGILRPDHAIEGLRWAAADARAPGIEMRLALLVDEEDGVVVDAAYQAFGPPTLIALGELLCERLIRQHWMACKQMTPHDLWKTLLDDEIPLKNVQEWGEAWLTLVHELCQTCEGLPAPTTPFMTPLHVDDLEPGQPLEGWEEMSMEQKIQVLNSVLDQEVRPYIALDAGGLIIQEFQEPMLKVLYSGTCVSCPSSLGSTLHAIQQTLRAKVHPDIIVIPDFPSADPSSSSTPIHASL